MTMLRPTAIVAKISMKTTVVSSGNGSGKALLSGWNATRLRTG
jgi:hypothetical protein